MATKAVLEAEEKERTRIATDLHDGVGQILTAALINYNRLVSRFKNPTVEDNLLADRTLALLNESYDEMRSISHQMMPNSLVKAGLAVAVKEMLNKVQSETLRVTLETQGLHERLDNQTETVLYRILQEIVSNVTKHSGANKLSIQLIKDADGVSLTVEDNGVGFNPKVVGLNGIGLKNMMSRINFLKGDIDIDSAVGKGTLIAIHIPVG
jgi:signal transduction histidine kinase